MHTIFLTCALLITTTVSLFDVIERDEGENMQNGFDLETAADPCDYRIILARMDAPFVLEDVLSFINECRQQRENLPSSQFFQASRAERLLPQPRVSEANSLPLRTEEMMKRREKTSASDTEKRGITMKGKENNDRISKGFSKELLSGIAIGASIQTLVKNEALSDPVRLAKILHAVAKSIEDVPAPDGMGDLLSHTIKSHEGHLRGADREDMITLADVYQMLMGQLADEGYLPNLNEGSSQRMTLDDMYSVDSIVNREQGYAYVQPSVIALQGANEQDTLGEGERNIESSHSYKGHSTKEHSQKARPPKPRPPPIIPLLQTTTPHPDTELVTKEILTPETPPPPIETGGFYTVVGTLAPDTTTMQRLAPLSDGRFHPFGKIVHPSAIHKGTHGKKSESELDEEPSFMIDFEVNDLWW